MQAESGSDLALQIARSTSSAFVPGNLVAALRDGPFSELKYVLRSGICYVRGNHRYCGLFLSSADLFTLHLAAACRLELGFELRNERYMVTLGSLLRPGYKSLSILPGNLECKPSSRSANTERDVNLVLHSCLRSCLQSLKRIHSSCKVLKADLCDRQRQLIIHYLHAEVCFQMSSLVVI